jgi:hypothetical protein
MPAPLVKKYAGPPKSDDVVLLILGIRFHVHDALLPGVLGMDFVKRRRLVVQLDVFHAVNLFDAVGDILVDACGDDQVDVRRRHRLVCLVHARQQLVGHAKHGSNCKHARADAQHHQQRADLVVPQIEPDFSPDDAHRKSQIPNTGYPLILGIRY